MKLKNVLIVVKDIEKARRFYHDLFDLELIHDNDGNMILTDGLVLQEEKYWTEFLGKEIISENNSSEHIGSLLRPPFTEQHRAQCRSFSGCVYLTPIWWTNKDLNLEPIGYEPIALTVVLLVHIMPRPIAVDQHRCLLRMLIRGL